MISFLVLYIYMHKQINTDYSGAALERIFGSLTLSGVAKEMVKMPWNNFLTAVRGVLFGLSLNVLDANACVKGAQGDIDAEIAKAYNAAA
ncbi:hypothetical protein [Larkinella soli]|uniref:hypothetical protein n=1 Tax=Larkinella soli TaxID=1770527 RepID=UPI000FFBC049|nr:hypothetical protein [Larkinella soli]